VEDGFDPLMSKKRDVPKSDSEKTGESKKDYAGAILNLFGTKPFNPDKMDNSGNNLKNKSTNNLIETQIENKPTINVEPVKDNTNFNVKIINISYFHVKHAMIKQWLFIKQKIPI
jgi:hypothetical protein